MRLFLRFFNLSVSRKEIRKIYYRCFKFVRRLIPLLFLPMAARLFLGPEKVFKIALYIVLIDFARRIFSPVLIFSSYFFIIWFYTKKRMKLIQINPTSQTQIKSIQTRTTLSGNVSRSWFRCFFFNSQPSKRCEYLLYFETYFKLLLTTTLEPLQSIYSNKLLESRFIFDTSATRTRKLRKIPLELNLFKLTDSGRLMFNIFKL